MITNSIIAHGDQLGAQMTTLANLLFLAKENNQDLCFYKEFKNFRRRFQIFRIFSLFVHIKNNPVVRASWRIKNNKYEYGNVKNCSKKFDIIFQKKMLCFFCIQTNFFIVIIFQNFF